MFSLPSPLFFFFESAPLINSSADRYPPFFDDNPFGIYEKILAGKIQFPSHFDANAKDLVKKLLTADRTKRIGNLKSGAEDIKQHKWFKGITWQDVWDCKLEVSPFFSDTQ